MPATAGNGPESRLPVLLTIDLEDWHQLAGRAIGRHGWDVPHAEFVQQVDDTLALLRELDVRATFFVLGITARNHPEVIERIAAEMHEIASHGFAHVRAWRQTKDEFRRDVERGLAVLAELGIPTPAGYRAPAFSLTAKTPWASHVLAEIGFRYDSSYYDSPRIPHRLPASERRLSAWVDGSVVELPIAVANIAGRHVPIGGGSYWRVLPSHVIKKGLAQLAADPGFPVLYFHPYELGRAPLRLGLQPGSRARLRAQSAWKQLRYNVGRGRVAELLTDMVERFRLVPCREVLSEVEFIRRVAAAESRHAHRRHARLPIGTPLQLF